MSAGGGPDPSWERAPFEPPVKTRLHRDAARASLRQPPALLQLCYSINKHICEPHHATHPPPALREHVDWSGRRAAFSDRGQHVALMIAVLGATAGALPRIHA